VRFSILIGALAMAMAPVCFGALPTVPDIAVCVKNSYLVPPGVLERAKHMATGMFKAADVDLAWVETEEAGRRTGAPLYLEVTLVTAPSWSAKKGSDALAQARPFALTSSAITIRYDRLLQTIGPDKQLETALLAHTLAHELGHMVENVDHHSETGVMKPRWDGGDYREMSWKPMEFAPEDVLLMRQGLREWQRRAGVAAD
jgi:hypothetical protein